MDGNTSCAANGKLSASHNAIALDITRAKATLSFKFLEIAMRLALSVFATSFAILTSSATLGHEFWIEPKEFQVENGENIVGDLINGQNFDGVKLSFFEKRFRLFDLSVDGTTQPVAGRTGDRPALNVTAPEDGLHVFSYVSTDSRVKYEEWDKWLAFADHKKFDDVATRHAARDLPLTNFWEAYSRFAKSVVAVGSGEGADQALGLEIEFVMLTNPYVDQSDTVQVRLLYQGSPRPDAQIELFTKAPDGTVTIELYKTDNDGVGTLPVKPGYRYLADNVVLREPSAELAAEKDAVWETVWASLTWAMPAE